MMMLRTWLVVLLLIAPAVSRAADKEIVRLQRDVALLNEDVRRLKTSIEQRMDNLVVMVQGALDRMAQWQETSSLTQRTLVAYRQQRQEKIDGLVLTLEQVRADCGSMKDTALDLDARLEGVERELSEVSNAVRIIQAPAPPPPSVPKALGGPPARMDAGHLFNPALRDKAVGRYEVAGPAVSRVPEVRRQH
jgi:hypothetical protein